MKCKYIEAPCGIGNNESGKHNSLDDGLDQQRHKASQDKRKQQIKYDKLSNLERDSNPLAQSAETPRSRAYYTALLLNVALIDAFILVHVNNFIKFLIILLSKVEHFLSDFQKHVW
jgi:hypothetical protein